MKERGQGVRNAVEQPPGRVADLRSLLGLDFVPPLLDPAGRIQPRLAPIAREDVRVATHQLVADLDQGIRDAEVPGLALELRDEDGLEDEVSQLLADGGMVARVDGFEELVRFFEHERLQRVDRLLAVPRAAVGPAKRGHDVDEARERLESRWRWRHSSKINRTP